MEKHAIQDGKKGSSGEDADEEPDSDPMFKQAVEVVIDAGQASTSLLPVSYTHLDVYKRQVQILLLFSRKN